MRPWLYWSRGGLTPDTLTFDSLISALCKESKLDVVITFLDYMISSGYLPDVLYSVIGFVYKQKCRRSFNYKWKIRRNRVSPDYYTLTSAYGKIKEGKRL